jgi:hypothetical protein
MYIYMLHCHLCIISCLHLCIIDCICNICHRDVLLSYALLTHDMLDMRLLSGTALGVPLNNGEILT